jgi:hypothetical protein
MLGFPQVCFIKNTVRNPSIVIGDDRGSAARYRLVGLADRQVSRNLAAIVGADLGALRASA